ncbi:MAG: sigma-70 family RNA polymerase sigma factor [Lachnospiraceae bacterium]|nr:sigma-70 family RNA polymerase sigma factor [Lachnospiraceae bacterium]
MQNEYVKMIYEKYSKSLYKISIIMLRNEQDARDAVQDTFEKYIYSKRCFDDDEHEKAWLIRVNINICRNYMRFHKMHPTVDYETLSVCTHSNEQNEIMDVLLKLKPKYKEPLILYYIEGYSCKEVAEILNISESAAKKRLERARKRLKEEYGDV